MKFSEIYHIHKDLVYNLALHYCQNKEDAEEITQDVFVSIHQKISTFKHEAELKTWIYRITINKSLDFIKAKKRHKRSFFFSALKIDDPETVNSLSNFDHPGVLLEYKQSIAKIFSCINQLPEKQKTVIILLKIEQKSQAETAGIMNTSTKAVESLYQRAKKNLEKNLNKAKENE